MDWDPEIRAKFKKLQKLRKLRERRELKEETNVRKHHLAPALQPINQPMASETKMVIGDWYTDELGNHTRVVYGANSREAGSKYGK
jgi:hypothetical protein